MTKAQLERRYEYLLLQLKVINQLAEEQNLSDKKMWENLGAITYYSRAKNIKENLQFIEDFNESYNFFNKTMNIDDYKF